MLITLSPQVAPLVRLGVLIAAGADNRREDPELARALDEAARRARAERAELDAEIQAIRGLYRRTGLDPTKTRPSSEALLRRVRKGQPLQRINALVDICNWCSLEFQVPYGLYDLDRISGEAVELRFGAPGEEFPGIRKDAVHVAGRLTLADREGPFGNPTSDSARTMVTPETQRVLVAVYAPHGGAASRLERILQTTAERLAAFTGATETTRDILGH